MVSTGGREIVSNGGAASDTTILSGGTEVVSSGGVATSPFLLRRLLTVHSVTVETHEAGLALTERYDLSIYDAMIAASALPADCDTL